MNKSQTVTLEVSDPKAVKPVKQRGMLKSLFLQLQSIGNPPLTGEESPAPKLIGDGNYLWYPLAWTRWLARWEFVKTLILAGTLAAVFGIYWVVSHKNTLEIEVPSAAAETFLKAHHFDQFNRNQAESFLIYVLNAANQTSAEGAMNLNLLEGSVEPDIYLRLQQQALNAQYGQRDAKDIPVNTLYISETTRWRYNPNKRVIAAYVKGFKVSTQLTGTGTITKYRAQVEIFWEPTSNRNRWGFYLTKLEEYLGTTADAYDAELANKDKVGI